MNDRAKLPFEIGDLVHFTPRSGFPAGMEGVVIGFEVWLNEDTSIDLDGLSKAPASLLSASEAVSRVVVQIPLQWPTNKELATLKGVSKNVRNNFGQHAYLIMRAGPMSLELDSVAEIEKRVIGNHVFWDAYCDHDKSIHAMGSTPQMARLKLAHVLLKQPQIV
jgi:hypothetical protein